MQKGRSSCRDTPAQEHMQGAHHKDAHQVHVSIAGAGAAEILIILQDVPARLQRLPELSNIGLPLAELQSHREPCQPLEGLLHTGGTDSHSRPHSRLLVQECIDQVLRSGTD